MFRGLLALLGDWVVMVVAIWAAGRIDHIAAYALAVIVLGNRMHCLALLGHEATHGLLVKPRWLNNLLGEVLCMWPLGADMFGYKAFHMKHHRYLNLADDPEMELRRPGGWAVPRQPADYVFSFLFDLLGGGIPLTILILSHFMPKTLGTFSGIIAMWDVAITALAWTGNLWVVQLWIVSLNTSLVAFLRFCIWLEHIGTSDTHCLDLSWWQGWLLAPHYSWMHWEHHEWPSIPCWNLTEARAFAPEPTTLTLGELIRFYRDCPKIESGTPLRDSGGKSLMPAK